jgi:DNA-binding HxlR family transcriptional regulator
MDHACTIYQTMDFASKKWMLLILLEMYKSNKEKVRYSEIKKNMEEITPKVLSNRLKELEDQGLITKTIDASEFPVKSFYQLTPSGNEFITVIKTLKQWALKWKVDNKICQSLDCKHCPLKIKN